MFSQHRLKLVQGQDEAGGQDADGKALAVAVARRGGSPGDLEIAERAQGHEFEALPVPLGEAGVTALAGWPPPRVRGSGGSGFQDNGGRWRS